MTPAAEQGSGFMVISKGNEDPGSVNGSCCLLYALKNKDSSYMD